MFILEVGFVSVIEGREEALLSQVRVGEGRGRQGQGQGSPVSMEAARKLISVRVNRVSSILIAVP